MNNALEPQLLEEPLVFACLVPVKVKHVVSCDVVYTEMLSILPPGRTQMRFTRVPQPV